MLQKQLQISEFSLLSDVNFKICVTLSNMRQCGCSCRKMYVYVRVKPPQVCGTLYQWILVKKCLKSIVEPLYYDIFSMVPQRFS